MIQGSEEWKQARVGIITASQLSNVLATTKTGVSASRANYMAELVAQRMTGQQQESFSNAAMQWGIDNEPIARGMYEIATGRDVDQVGLVAHPTIKNSAASPDGLVGIDGLLEIKCPNTATHIGYLLAGEPPKKYIPQMAWQCACTSRAWCDFVSFDPRMDKPDQLFLVRYTPTSEYLATLLKEVLIFDAEVKSMIQSIIERREV